MIRQLGRLLNNMVCLFVGMPTGNTGGGLPVTFRCQCCGDCCSTMGEIIIIQDQIGPGEFRIQYPDGEERVVSVDPDRRDLFLDHGPDTRKSIACPFLRRVNPHERICTVYKSRPEICRGYLCSRILVIGGDGSRAGRVPYGTRSFTTEDRILLDLWNEHIRDIRFPDDDLWENHVEDVFVRSGYRVIR